MMGLGFSYHSCSFALKIPNLTVFADRAEIKSLILHDKQKSAEAIVLDYCKLIDKNRATFTKRPESMFYPATTENRIISVSIPAPQNKIVYAGATLFIVLLTQFGKRVEITFLCNQSFKFQLKTVRIEEMDEDDIARFEAVHQAYLKPAASLKLDPTPTPALGSIDAYISALMQEKSFLKNHGGHKYKVTNGRRISAEKGICTYIFDLETELYLADDAPVKLTTGGGLSATGSVLLCEGFKIVLVIDGDLGGKIGAAYVSVEPWKLLDSLSARLQKISSADHIAMRLLKEGPTLSKKKALSEIATGQSVAKEMARKNDITVIWGPPGTGKTHTMAEIAIEALSQNKTILVVSHSNISVDGVVLKIAEQLEKKSLHSVLAQGKVLRYGYVRDEKLANNPYATSFNFALQRSPTLKAEMDRLHLQKDKLKGVTFTNEHLVLTKKIKEIRAALHTEEQAYVEEAKLVATTASKLYADKLFDEKKYDIVMFDEVSMAYVPQILCAAAFAREHLVCVGDFRQLAPISQSKAKENLDKDIFTFLRITDTQGNIYYHPWLVLLDEQRRMHPAVSAFPSKTFYHGLLRDHVSVFGSRDSIINKAPFEGNPISIVDMSGTYCAASKNNDNSRYNILSAITSFAVALSAEQSKEASIGIITPYAAQTRLIRALIQDYRKNGNTEIACSTVHQFQGSERNLIVFDAVESYPSKHVGWLMSKNDNNSLNRLINVAITRARGKLVVVANRGFWQKKFALTLNAVYLLIQYLAEKGNVVSLGGKRLENFYQNAYVGKGLTIYTSAQSCITELVSDISNAKKKVLIALPDDQLNMGNVAPIQKAVAEAIKRGVACDIKAKALDGLPAKWKDIAIETDNALFPLIIIDDKILWYGFPLTTEQFTDGTAGFATLLHTIVRITGENTIEIIKSLSEIEPVGKSSVSNPSGEGPQGGFATYITQKEFCPICKQHFKLVHSYKTGKYFLSCSNKNCSNMKPLNPQLIQLYLDQNDVRCSKHNCELTLQYGPFGPYVHCDCGHNLKLTEI